MAVLGITLVMVIAGLYSVMWVCVNGPSKRARELFVLSVRETSAAGFLADIFCTQEEIQRLEQANRSEDNVITDTSLINAGADGTKPDNEHDAFTTADNSADADSNSNSNSNSNTGTNTDNTESGDIEFHKVSGSTYRGIMMIVKDPSRIMVGTSAPKYEEGIPGKKVADMIKSYNAVGGVNAGGFEDINGAGDGGIPIGLVISEGKMRYGEPDMKYDIIGMSRDNVLIIGSMTAARAMQMNIRDAVSFGPALIINGEATKASGGGGFNPRTAIGQRADGAVLLLVIDGRQSASLGATYGDITRIMLKFGAVNAANLDGGSSSVMYYKGELLNTCCSLYGPREMPTCILIKEKEHGQ